MQGTIVADGVTSSRQFFNLVNAFQPPTTITLRLTWITLGAKVLLDIDSGVTLAAERYNVLSLRVGEVR